MTDQELREAFLAAKESDCQDPATWEALALLYIQRGGANMNAAYCYRRSLSCQQVPEQVLEGV